MDPGAAAFEMPQPRASSTSLNLSAKEFVPTGFVPPAGRTEKKIASNSNHKSDGRKSRTKPRKPAASDDNEAASDRLLETCIEAADAVPPSATGKPSSVAGRGEGRGAKGGKGKAARETDGGATPEPKTTKGKKKGAKQRPPSEATQHEVDNQEGSDKASNRNVPLPASCRLACCRSHTRGSR